MKRFVAFVVGILFGAMLGASLALLLTPVSGEELRDEARVRLDDVVTDIRSAVDQERGRLEAELEQLKRGEIKIG